MQQDFDCYHLHRSGNLKLSKCGLTLAGVHKLLLECAQGHEQLQAAAVLELEAPQLLACGLSRQKAAYIADLAQRFHAGTLETQTIVGGITVTVLMSVSAVPSRTYTVDLINVLCI